MIGDAGSRELEAPGSRGDRAFFGGTRALGALVIALPTLMLVSLTYASRGAIATLGLRFLTDDAWDPIHRRFGALAFLYGTAASSAVAIALAAPVAIGVAIALTQLVPRRVERVFGVLVELLAAVPSVVYGFWGVFVLVPFLREHVEPALARALGFLPLFRGAPLGFGMLAAGSVLAIMIVPTIASVSREVLRAVPGAHREAAIGLGATRWDAVRFGVLPSARSGLIGAVLLGLGRALGETMAVAMVIGNRPAISASLFAPGATMASALANEFAEADTDLHLAALSEVALLLLVATLVANLAARGLVGRARGRSPGASPKSDPAAGGLLPASTLRGHA